MDLSLMLIACFAATSGAVLGWWIARSRATTEVAVLNERVAGKDVQLAASEQQVSALTSDNAALTEANAEISTWKAQLGVQLDELRKSAYEKIRLLNEAKESLRQEFENLANRIFEANSEKFTDQNKKNIAEILVPL